MKILITGPQASGKTTQTHLLSKALGFCEVDSGDLIRAYAKGAEEKHKEVGAALRAGQLIDNQLAAELVKERVSFEDCKDGVVIDGYPRSLDQLKFFDPEFDKVFYLEIPDEVAVQRALRRGRVDDNPEIVRARMKIFHQKTEEVLNYYEKQGKLVKVDATLPPEQVSEKILEYLK